MRYIKKPVPQKDELCPRYHLIARTVMRLPDNGGNPSTLTGTRVPSRRRSARSSGVICRTAAPPGFHHPRLAFYAFCRTVLSVTAFNRLVIQRNRTFVKGFSPLAVEKGGFSGTISFCAAKKKRFLPSQEKGGRGIPISPGPLETAKEGVPSLESPRKARRGLSGGVGRGRGGCRPSCVPVLPSIAVFFGDTKPRFFSVKETGF